MKIDKEIQSDLKNIFKQCFVGKVNNEKNRQLLVNQCTKYLVNRLYTDTVTYEADGEKDIVNLHVCYKGKRILNDGDADLCDTIEKCILTDMNDLRKK